MKCLRQIFLVALLVSGGSSALAANALDSVLNSVSVRNEGTCVPPGGACGMFYYCCPGHMCILQSGGNGYCSG